jgi:hypothetical protein
VTRSFNFTQDGAGLVGGITRVESTYAERSIPPLAGVATAHSPTSTAARECADDTRTTGGSPV